MSNRIYSGQGVQRPLATINYYHLKRFDDPKGYRASPELSDAVDVSILLGQPLLVTGEPGTGKTQLAKSLAYELDLDKPLIFNAKTTSTARDLFYQYDALRHFHDTRIVTNKELDISDYIEFEALGQAILLAQPHAKWQKMLPESMVADQARRSVVLIDEIDKAPRDFPNDILAEIEKMAFYVPELGETFSLQNQQFRPIVIITSNSEKNLPDAFLRRCIFHHIEFPKPDILKKIIHQRLPLSEEFRVRMLDDAIEHFLDIKKNKNLRKPPSTAELLAWIHILQKLEIDLHASTEDQIRKLAQSYSILAKNQQDLKKLQGR